LIAAGVRREKRKLSVDRVAATFCCRRTWTAVSVTADDSTESITLIDESGASAGYRLHDAFDVGESITTWSKRQTILPRSSCFANRLGA